MAEKKIYVYCKVTTTRVSSGFSPCIVLYSWKIFLWLYSLLFYFKVGHTFLQCLSLPHFVFPASVALCFPFVGLLAVSLISCTYGMCNRNWQRAASRQQHATSRAQTAMCDTVSLTGLEMPSLSLFFSLGHEARLVPCLPCLLHFLCNAPVMNCKSKRHRK